jgi:glycosyltransferase involved in cell wall biosynthesis
MPDKSSEIKLSAVILARNEEHNIRFCLETLGWCNEIVVVDMESSDHTAAIAREYTDRIFTHEIVTAFDIAKRYAVEQAQGEWILLVDADEMVPAALADDICRLVSENSHDVMEIPFQHYIMGAWVQNSGWGYTPLPRLFRRDAISIEKTIHGYMQIRDGARIYRLPSLPGRCIVHFNYRDCAHFMEKLNRYTGVEAEHLCEQGAEFSYPAMLRAALHEFYCRYLKGKGYRDGVRGFALSAMMAFYRILTQLKLWEMREFMADPVESRYGRLRSTLLEEWREKRG